MANRYVRRCIFNFSVSSVAFIGVEWTQSDSGLVITFSGPQRLNFRVYVALVALAVTRAWAQLWSPVRPVTRLPGSPSHFSNISNWREPGWQMLWLSCFYLPDCGTEDKKRAGGRGETPEHRQAGDKRSVWRLRCTKKEPVIQIKGRERQDGIERVPLTHRDRPLWQACHLIRLFFYALKRI